MKRKGTRSDSEEPARKRVRTTTPPIIVLSSDDDEVMPSTSEAAIRELIFCSFMWVFSYNLCIKFRVMQIHYIVRGFPGIFQ